MSKLKSALVSWIMLIFGQKVMILVCTQAIYTRNLGYKEELI